MNSPLNKELATDILAYLNACPTSTKRQDVMAQWAHRKYVSDVHSAINMRVEYDYTLRYLEHHGLIAQCHVLGHNDKTPFTHATHPAYKITRGGREFLAGAKEVRR